MQQDWDNEMGWDRNYATNALMCDAEIVKNNMPRLLRNRTTESIVEAVRKNGLACSMPSLRRSIFSGTGIIRKKNPGTPANIIKTGCNVFITLPIFRNYCRLLQELGIEYDFLDKEYCCLAPALYGVLMRGQDRSQVDAEARKMLLGNVAQARVAGAQNMVNFCLYCHWRARWLLADSSIAQLYAFDVLTPPELWKGHHLHLDRRVGYLIMDEKTATNRLRVYVPESVAAESVQVAWADYRSLLDRVEGLQVVNVSNYVYPQGSEVIFEQMRRLSLETLVVNHPYEYTNLTNLAARVSPVIKIKFLTDILLQAIGVDLW